MSVPIKPNTIFVSIASYRDDVCNSTLHSLFTMAENPTNVFVGICQQNKQDEDKDCLDSFYNNSNVRIIRLSHLEAKGPTWARYLCSTLWNGEQYYLQIDSHTSFVKNWDTKCINMINKLKEKGFSKPILSHYPRIIEEYEAYNENNDDKYMVPRMCKSFFNDRDMLSFEGAKGLHTGNDFYETPYIAGGFFFCDSSFLNDVPFDPHLPYLFIGEEISHSIRFWTAGWNIFTPSENIVFHEYTRAEKPKIWTDRPNYSDADAFEKVKQLIGLESSHNVSEHVKLNIEQYGLGKVRTLEQYFEFAGIDKKNKKVLKDFCEPNNTPQTSPSIEQFGNIGNFANRNFSTKELFLIFYLLFCIYILFLQ